MSKEKTPPIEDAAVIGVSADLSPSEKFKAEIKAKIAADAIEAAKPKVVPKWTAIDERLYGTSDPNEGDVLRTKDRERRAELDEVGLLADQCFFTKPSGALAYPHELKRFLQTKGYSVKDARAACEHFSKHGWWQAHGCLFGDKGESA